MQDRIELEYRIPIMGNIQWIGWLWFGLMVFNATFNNIVAVSYIGVYNIQLLIV
jgi:hypothetical protein